MRGDYMLSAVTKALVAHFGGDKVFVERPPQDAPAEYLFVHQINREQTADFGQRYNRYYFFDVRYHPDDKKGTGYRNFTLIEEELTEVLLYVATDDQSVKASSMRSEVQDGVLHFFADYPVRVFVPAAPQPDMTNIETNSNLKE